MVSSVQRGVGAFKALPPVIQQSTAAFSATVANANLANGAIMKVGATADQGASKLKKFGDFVGGNKGLIFGFAGLASAAGEAAGMIGMYNDTAALVAEDQKKLNSLMAQGVTEGKELADAEQELAKHRRFMNMVTRNTILSQMDMIFFTTMAINGIIELSRNMTGAVGILGKLKNALHLGGAATKALDGALSGMSVSITKSSKAVKAVQGGLTPLNTLLPSVGKGANAAAGGFKAMAASALTVAGPLAAIAVAAGLAYQGIKQVSDFEKTLKQEMPGAPEFGPFEELGIRTKMLFNGATEQEKAKIKALDEYRKKADDVVAKAGISGADLLMGKPEDWKPKLQKGMQDAGVIIKNGVATIGSTLSTGDAKGKAGASLAGFWTDWAKNIKLANPIVQEQVGQLNKMMALDWATSGNLDKSRQITEDWVKSWRDAEGNPMSEGVIAAGLELTGAALDEFEKARGKSNKTDKEGMTVTEQVAAMDARATATKEALTKVQQDYADAEAEAAARMSQNARDVSELDYQQNLLNETLGSHISLGRIDWEVAQELIAAAEQKKNAYKAEEVELMKLAIAQGVTVPTAQEMLRNTVDETTALREHIAANIDWSKALTDSNEKAKQVSIGHLEGALALQEFTNNMVTSTASGEVFRAGLEKIVQKQSPMIDTTLMTTDELGSLAQQLVITSDSIVQYKQAADEAAHASLGFFDSLTTAEDNKAFKEAWKSLDLGDIPKNLRDDFKDMFKELNKINEEGVEAATALKGINTALHFDFGNDIDDKDISKTFDKVFQEIGKLVQKTGDVEGINIFDQILGPIEAMDKDERIKKLREIPGTVDAIANAFANGEVSLAEYNEVMAKNAIETGNANFLSQNQQEILADLGFKWDENTGKIDKITESTNTSTEATAAFNEEMAKIEVTGIVVQTIAEMWANLGAMIIQANLTLQESWSETVMNVAEMFAGLIEEIAKAWAELAKGLNKMNVAIANSWERAAKNILQNTKAATSQTQSEFAALPKKLNSHFVKIANNWETALKNMVNNTKTAANKIQSAMNSVKNVQRYIYVDTVYRKAHGGIESAAAGKITTYHGPTLVGDNPGGNETVAYIPHNNPWSILEPLLGMFSGQGHGAGSKITGKSGSAGGDIVLNLTVVTPDGSFTKKYRARQGQDLAQQVF